MIAFDMTQVTSRQIAHAVTCHQAKGGDPTTDNYVITHALTAAGCGASAERLRDGSHGALPMVAATLVSNGDAQNGHRDEHGLIATATMDVHPTLAASTGGPGSQDWRQQNAVASGMAVRRLTPRECSRLMAFPDDWLDLDPPLPDSTKYRMLGNSVVVNVTAWLGARIAASAAREDGA